MFCENLLFDHSQPGIRFVHCHRSNVDRSNVDSRKTLGTYRGDQALHPDGSISVMQPDHGFVYDRSARRRRNPSVKTKRRVRSYFPIAGCRTIGPCP